MMNIALTVYEFVLGYFKDYGFAVVVCVSGYLLTTRWANDAAKNRYKRMLSVLEDAIAAGNKGAGISADVTTYELLKLYDAGATKDWLSTHNASTKLAVLYICRWETRLALDRLKARDKSLEEQERLLRGTV